MPICSSVAAIGLHLASIHAPSHRTVTEEYRLVSPGDQPGLRGPQAISISREARYSYNDVNPGLYVRCDSGIQFGAFYNSERSFSTYAAWLGDMKLVGPLSAWGAVGLATGYRRADVLPMVMVGAKLDLGKRLALRAGYVPKVRGVNDANLFHLALEWKPGQR